MRWYQIDRDDLSEKLGIGKIIDVGTAGNYIVFELGEGKNV